MSPKEIYRTIVVLIKMKSLKLEDRIKDPNTIWRVLHLVQGQPYARTMYSGRGEQAKKIAEQKYGTIMLEKGRIGLYIGIYPMKIRRAYKIPKV